MAVTALKPRNAVESLREIVQDLAVPDLKAIKSEVESHRRETKIEFDSVRTEIRLRDEKQAEAIRHLDEKLSGAIRHLDENLTTETKQLSDSMKELAGKMDNSAEFRQRLAALETTRPKS